MWHRNNPKPFSAFIFALFLPSAVAMAATADVRVRNYVFVPESVGIVAQDSVLWTREEGIHHTVTSGESGSNAGTLFDASIGAVNPTFTYTFTTPGPYPYFCRPHSLLGMSGLVVVAAALPEEARAAAAGPLLAGANERGAATLYLHEAGREVRLTDLSMTSRTNVRVGLATSSAPSDFDDPEQVVDLGPLAAIAGTLMYPVSEETNAAAYHTVIIWSSDSQEVLAAAALEFTPSPEGDINADNKIDAIDVQLTINASLGVDISPLSADVDGNSAVDALDIQLVINGALGQD